MTTSAWPPNLMRDELLSQIRGSQGRVDLGGDNPDRLLPCSRTLGKGVFEPLSQRTSRSEQPSSEGKVHRRDRIRFARLRHHRLRRHRVRHHRVGRRQCNGTIHQFEQGRNTRSHVWFRWFNEIPVLILLATVILVVVKPF